MLKDARSGAVWCDSGEIHSPDYQRNMEHTEYLLHSLFPLLGIRFIGVVDGVDTAQKYGRKARQINALVNEWYSEDLSEASGQYIGRKWRRESI